MFMLASDTEEGIEFNYDAISYKVEALFGYMNPSDEAQSMLKMIEEDDAEDGQLPSCLEEMADSIKVIAAFPADEFNSNPSEGVLYRDDYVIILNNEGIFNYDEMPYCLYSIR